MVLLERNLPLEGGREQVDDAHRWNGVHNRGATPGRDQRPRQQRK
jgi:hypothetical protein